MTRTLRFHMLNVFTDRGFSGSRLIVVEGADSLTASDRDAIAREFDHTTVAFLVAERNPICAGRIHVHTPSSHSALAGNAAIGTAVLIAETRAREMLASNEIVIELERDAFPDIRCEVIRNSQGISFARELLPRLPRRAGDALAAQDIARALGLQASDIGFDDHRPTVYASDFPTLFVPVAHEGALFSARPHMDSFAEALGDAESAYLYTRETQDPHCVIRARAFAKPDGREESAMASAAAAFAGVAHEFEQPEEGEHQLFIGQGDGRLPSRITLGMTVRAGRLTAVSIGGQAVRVGEGTLRL